MVKTEKDAPIKDDLKRGYQVLHFNNSLEQNHFLH